MKDETVVLKVMLRGEMITKEWRGTSVSNVSPNVVTDWIWFQIERESGVSRVSVSARECLWFETIGKETPETTPA